MLNSYTFQSRKRLNLIVRIKSKDKLTLEYATVTKWQVLFEKEKDQCNDRKTSLANPTKLISSHLQFLKFFFLYFTTR